MTIILLPLLLALQITPVQPIVKGTALPPPGTEEAGVMVPIDTMLAALEKEDGAAILAVTRPEGGATVAYEGANGKRGVKHLSWADFAAGMKAEADRYREEIRDPAIEVDGDVAMVWAPYTVFRNGAPEHCGYDHFDLVREDGRWKVLNVTWSQRTTGCGAS